MKRFGVLVLASCISGGGALAQERPSDREVTIGAWKVAIWVEDGREVRVSGVATTESMIVAGGCEGGVTTLTIWNTATNKQHTVTNWDAVKVLKGMHDGNQAISGARRFVKRVARACKWSYQLD